MNETLRQSLLLEEASSHSEAWDFYLLINLFLWGVGGGRLNLLSESDLVFLGVEGVTMIPLI